MADVDSEISGNASVLPIYSNTSRPSADSVPKGFVIFNTDDNTLNVSDGTDWRDMVGLIT